MMKQSEYFFPQENLSEPQINNKDNNVYYNIKYNEDILEKYMKFCCKKKLCTTRTTFQTKHYFFYLFTHSSHSYAGQM